MEGRETSISMVLHSTGARGLLCVNPIDIHTVHRCEETTRDVDVECKAYFTMAVLLATVLQASDTEPASGLCCLDAPGAHQSPENVCYKSGFLSQGYKLGF